MVATMGEASLGLLEVMLQDARAPSPQALAALFVLMQCPVLSQANEMSAKVRACRQGLDGPAPCRSGSAL